MRMVLRKNLWKLLDIIPENCIIIEVSQKGFIVKSRLVDEYGIRYRQYHNRIYDWKVFKASQYSRNILKEINKSEHKATVKEEICDNAIDKFMVITSKLKAYVVTENEFVEVIPALSDGEYLLIIAGNEN